VRLQGPVVHDPDAGADDRDPVAAPHGARIRRGARPAPAPRARGRTP
jgi:hypothetical protein